jgi:pimeloyl-ACP methyl ester carboxylesterase
VTPGLGEGRLLGPPGERLHAVHRVAGVAATPALLVHGFPSNLVAWTRVVERLPPERGFVAVDLLGLGRSDRNHGVAHSPAAHAGRIAAILDALGMDRVVAVGLSYGGAGAQWLAATHPERVHRLVLVASVDAGRAEDLRRHWRLQALAMRAGLLVPPLARRVLTAGMRAESMDPATLTPAVVDAYLRPLLRAGTGRSLWAYGRDAASDGPLDHRRIGAPTVLVHGTRDGSVPIAVGRRLAAAIPGARLHEVDGGRHLLTWDRPDLLAELITDER